MNESEFSAKFLEEVPLFKAWGEFVQNEIETELTKLIGAKSSIEVFLKIPSHSRIKALDSLLNKAFHRGKGYQNPYDEITDKVGLRFVVLLEKDIETLCSIVESNNNWSYSKDRNYLVERLDKPTVFDYQSIHYVVRSKDDMDIEGTQIPAGTPCEIQIRTLLQHAYSELTHDTIYKSLHEADSDTQRIVAKSMALIETADELFTKADQQIQSISNEYKQLLGYLSDIYMQKVAGIEYFDEKLNAFILDSIWSEIEGFDVDGFKKDIVTDELSFIYEKISQRKEQSSVFRQPVSIFIYYLARNSHRALKKVWPLTEAELEPFLSDMGHSS